MADVVLPVLDEREALPWVLARMPAGYSPLVVDNGSSDGSFDPRELPRVADPVGAGRCDLVLGARAPAPGSWPAHARAANSLLAWELRRRTGVSLHDLGPMRAARRDALLGLGIEDRRCGWPLEMVLLAAAAGWRIDEVSIGYHPRRGRSKVTGTVGGTIRAVRDIAAVLA